MKKSLGAKTILYPTPVLIIGSYDSDGKPNAMNCAWGGVSCSKPPCVSVSVQPVRYTHRNITTRGAFTINVPSVDHIKEADYFGITSGRDNDKFAITGLTPVKSELVDAPYIQEFPLTLECKLVHTFELGQHTQFVGEIVDVKVEESALGEDGQPDLAKINPVIYAPGSRMYHAVGTAIGSAYTLGKKFS